jgi:hypothetical protein
MGDEQVLLEDLKRFLLPGGAEAARNIVRIRTTEKGEMRASPGARLIPYTARQTMEASCSGFVWEAKMWSSRIVPTTVVDAYEGGHGRLVAKAGGAVPLANFRGPEVDKGEIQRYLASIMSCPATLVSHRTLEWTVVGPRVLRVRDTADLTGATVDMEIGGDGRPVVCRALRPRAVGKKTVDTPWSALGKDFREHEGLRIPFVTEARWQYPECEFTYFHGELASIHIEKLQVAKAPRLES